MTSPTPADLYLDLMTKVLIRYGFEGRNVTLTVDGGTYEHYLWEMLQAAVPGRRIRLVEPGEFRSDLRDDGRDWPADAESMIGLRRMTNVRTCVEQALADDVPGDLMETGVWRGGACILMRAVLKAHGITDRKVWLADSFEGLPAFDGRYEADIGDQFHSFGELAISIEEVRENFSRYDLLDDQVEFLVGWFSDTLPTAPVERLAVLRLDGDMYASTMDALQALYDRVSPGGFVIVDDYGAVPGCAQAIDDFRESRGILDPLEAVDWSGVFWRKSA